MESREEIESMRVVDLREFLRRHGHPMKPVTRPNGTPGPMRKSELLEAALEIRDSYIKGQPSPTRLSTENTSPNPFQSGISTPPEQRQPASSSAITDDRRPVESPAQEETPSKPRRRSAAWVDPVLLAQMRATTPTKSKGTPSHTRSTPARNSLATPQQLPSRALPKPSPIRPPQRLVRQPPPESPASRPARRVLGSTPTRKPALISRVPLTPRRLALRKSHPESPSSNRDQLSRPDAKQDVHAPSEPTPSSIPIAKQGRALPARRTLMLEADDDYVSEEDPDYDADAEEAEEEDEDEEGIDLDDDAEYVGGGALAASERRYMDADYAAAFRAREDIIDVDADLQEDIPIDSDQFPSASAGESDPGSTIETEDENQVRNFADWSTADVKAWLLDHSVKFFRGANRDALISVARAHALHMEATSSSHRQDSDHGHVLDEQIEIAPSRPSAGGARRRRTISAPPPDDDNEVMEIQPAPPVATSSGRTKGPNRDFVYHPKPVGVGSKTRRPAYVLLPLILLFVFLCSSGFVALSVLQKHLTMTYCDTNATSTMLENGIECRPCPRNGHCANGVLECDSGFVELRGRCLEDKEFNLLSERLAYRAFELLSQLAGRAECGEDVPSAVSPDELETAMQSLYTRRRQPLDEQKFKDAMSKAILTLQTDDTFDVSTNENGYLSSNRPTFSFSCRVKRKVWEYMRAFLATVGILILLAYVRIKRYFWELHEQRLDEAHANALEYLRDQVNAFRNNEEDVAFVPDVVLREEMVGRPTPENKKFWKEVEDRLNRDARVMRKHQVLKGMPSYTFEYVGSRRVSGRRNSGTFYESISRRSSFGSRTSLDSFDLGQEGNANVTPRKSFLGFVARFFARNTD